MSNENRRTRRTVLSATAGVLAGLAGCLGGENEVNVSEDEPDGGLTGESDEPPTWMTATLTDVTTDQQFSIIDAEQPVVLHTFETWCSKCQSQQENLDSLYEQRGDELLMVDLNIDENFDSEEMVQYAENNGYGWRFGITPSAAMRSLVDDFGQSVSIAPQAPVILVCPDGGAYELGKGIAAEEISTTVDDICQ
jgi:thiol-disulfide isomerase/thioredoxin